MRFLERYCISLWVQSCKLVVVEWNSSPLMFALCGPHWWTKCCIIWGLKLIQWKNSNWLHMSTGSGCWMHWIWYRYILLCIMFPRLSELRSVLQGLIPELIMSQKYHTVYIHMGLICNGCRVWSSWSVATHFTHDVVNSTRNSHLWDRDNPHETVESNYPHSFSLNMWCGVIGDQLSKYPNNGIDPCLLCIVYWIWKYSYKFWIVLQYTYLNLNSFLFIGKLHSLWFTLHQILEHCGRQTKGIHFYYSTIFFREYCCCFVRSNVLRCPCM